MDSPPHGKILVLRPRERGKTLHKNAVARVLMKYAERETPFVGILVDLTGVEYQFSSVDVGSVAAAIAAWVRGWVAPSAIATRGQPADDLRKVLDITGLSYAGGAASGRDRRFGSSAHRQPRCACTGRIDLASS